VRQAAGTATIIGDPDRYRDVGYPVCPDQVPKCGPIGGIYTALSVTASDWNLVVACDMPRLSAPVLRSLIDRSCQSASNCIVGAGPVGELHPLCAVYHRRCLPQLEQAICDKRFRMRDLLSELHAEHVALDPSVLANVNTPVEWARFEGRPA
jgi:molybdenum cofactor guanylyltransferase